MEGFENISIYHGILAFLKAVSSLVNANEGDIFQNRISTESPVGQTILGKKKGQIVEVATPVGTLKYKIVKIGKPG